MTANRIEQLRTVDIAVQGMGRVFQQWKRHPSEIAAILGVAVLDAPAIQNIEGVKSFAIDAMDGSCQAGWLLRWSECYAGLELKLDKRGRRERVGQGDCGPLHGPNNSRPRAFKDIEDEDAYKKAIDGTLKDLARYAELAPRVTGSNHLVFDPGDRMIEALASPGSDASTRPVSDLEVREYEEFGKMLALLEPELAWCVIQNCDELRDEATYWIAKMKLEQRIKEKYPAGPTQAQENEIRARGEEATRNFETAAREMMDAFRAPQSRALPTTRAKQDNNQHATGVENESPG